MRASDTSYLAGFLDGDGSIHFQFVKQHEYRFGFYIRASLSLSQQHVSTEGPGKASEHHRRRISA